MSRLYRKTRPISADELREQPGVQGLILLGSNAMDRIKELENRLAVERNLRAADRKALNEFKNMLAAKRRSYNELVDAVLFGTRHINIDDWLKENRP